jgi:AcrR family transcriptional regulator
MAMSAAGRRKVAKDPSTATRLESGTARTAAKARAKDEKVSIVDRRTRLLEAAAHRFAEQGFEATTVRQIADDVNILSGSLYHHFATKEDMLHEIVRDGVLQMRDNVMRIVETDISAEHRVVALVMLELGELTRNQEVHAILTNSRRFFRSKPEFAYVVAAKKETYHAWRKVLQDGIAAKLFKPDIDLFLTNLTIARMLTTAADWFKNEDVYVSGQDRAYTLDKIIDFPSAIPDHQTYSASGMRGTGTVSNLKR